MATQTRRKAGSLTIPPLSSSQSLPQLIGGDVNVATNGAAKCRGDFCRVALASLPGLYGTSHENDNDGHGEQGHVASTVLPDDGQRFKIGNNNLLLAKAEMAFLTDHVSSDDAALQWQEADNLHRAELGRGNPNAYYKQVAVCSNCHRIYSDLAALRDMGFSKRPTDRKNAWKTAEMGDAGKKAKQKTVTSKKATDMSRPGAGRGAPEEDDLDYDKMFLAELAKHSEAIEHSAFVSARRGDGGSARSEADPKSARRSCSGIESEGTRSLPVLSSAAKPTSVVPNKVVQKPNATTATSNNQPGGSVVVKDLATGATNLDRLVQELQDDLSSERRKVRSLEAQNQLLDQKAAHMQTLMEDKEAEFRKKLLEAEMNTVGKALNSGASRSQAGSTADVSELIETVDALNYQLDLSKTESEKLRRELQHAHQLEVKRIHERYQLDMETLRLSEHTAKEQAEAAISQMNLFQAEAQVASSQVKSSRSALDELVKVKLPALEEKNQRLERQLVEMKAKLATSQAPSAGSDIAAMEKHLNNKVEYLKAQLASEMKCKEELGTHLAQITASVESLKKDKRVALQEQEEAHKRHIERIESNFAQEKEVFCSQHAGFQGKIATLQANLTDLVQELALWKSRDANGKLAMEKMAEENVRLTRQIVDLEGQVETLQEERKRDGKNGVMSAKNASEETQRMQMEALLRRLDNERQYLKNQVDNEAELKAESQRRVVELSDELHELKSSSEEMTKLAEHTISTLKAEKSNVERQLRDEKAALEESKLMVSRQLKDLQVKFMQAREQTLVDKDELDKARIELQDARSQLIAAREEAVKEKEYGKTASERMSKALTTIKASLKAMEDDKNRQIQRLEGETALYMQKLASAQADLLLLENKAAEDKRQVRRQQTLTRLLSLVDRKLSSRHAAVQSSAFCRLQLQVVMARIVGGLVRTHSSEIRDLEMKWQLETDEKWGKLKAIYEAERSESVSKMTEIHNQEQDELHQFYRQERSQIEEELRHLHACQMRELEEQYEHTLKAVDEQSAASAESLQHRCDTVESERDEARVSFEELRRKYENLSVQMEKSEAASKAKLQEREAEWQHEREALVAAHEALEHQASQQLESQERALRSEHELSLEQLRQSIDNEHQSVVAQLRSELESYAAERERKLLEDHAKELEQIAKSHSVQMEAEKEAMNCNWQREFDRERQAHEKALKEALERVEIKTQSHLEGLQKEMNDRKSQALVQTTAKWQKAMEELQARLEVEKKAAYDAGVQDRENEWQQAALQIKQKQKEELENVQNEAVRAIKAAEERHQLMLQAEVTKLHKDLEDKLRQDLDHLREEITQKEKIKSDSEIEAALAKQATILHEKFDKEINSIRDELSDDHRVDMERLQEQFTKEKKMLLAEFQFKLEGLQEKLNGESEAKLEALKRESAAELERKLIEQQERLEGQFEKERERLDDAFSQELEAKLKEQEERLVAEQEEAINQVQEDSEKLIEQVEVAMGDLKHQKEALDNELTRLRGALEEAEDSHFDAEEKWKKQQKMQVFQLLSIVMHARRKEEMAKTSYRQQQEELQAKYNALDASLQAEKSKRGQDIAQITETWSQIQSRHSEMLQTLTNYKRDELVAHRSAGSVLSNEIAIVAKQMDEVVEMKSTLEKEIEQLQAEAQGVEASLRQLMLQSSSSLSNISNATDSGMNMAVVAKKRRLNEEFDALLEQMEKKKSEVRNIDKTLASLRLRREEKEGELKKMERKLVEILVGQQKQVLSQLNATREIPTPAPLVSSAS